MNNTLSQQGWKQFYDRIKDSSWPKCDIIDDFKKLPTWIQDEIKLKHFGQSWFALDNETEIIDFTDLYLDIDTAKPTAESNTDFDLQFQINDVSIFYNKELDGGGADFGQDFPSALRFLYGDHCFKNCLEWCAGPGFIGMAILAQELCDKLYLNDFYEPAIQACEKTIGSLPEKYKGKVTTLQTSTVKEFDDALVFDLVVANPPMFSNLNFMLVNDSTMIPDLRKELDKNWEAHKNFFANIGRHLTQDAKILLVESINGMSPWDMQQLFDPYQFKINRCFRFKKNPLSWYCEIIKIN